MDFIRQLASKSAGVPIDLGDADFGPIDTKPNRIACITDLIVESAWTLTGTANDTNYVVDGHLAEVLNATTLRLKNGAELAAGVEGHFWFLQWLLARCAADDQDIAKSAQESGITQLRWPFTYRFDAERYFVPSRDVDLLQIKRGGTSDYAVGADVTTLLAAGDFRVAAPLPRYRQWVEFNPSTIDINLPAGRYHFIAIVNDRAANANLFDGGILLSGPNCEIPVEDGRVLNRRFAESFGLADFMYSAADDESAVLEDMFQIIYCPEPFSQRWEDGLVGPLKIKTNSGDPMTNRVYALRCIE